MKWGKMRTIKVSHEKFARAVQKLARECQFINIPSSNRKYVFAGLIMPGGAWVAWPDNLNEEEMSKYIETYGNIPDLFTPKPTGKSVNFAPDRMMDEKED